jgi:hypothetical protein
VVADALASATDGAVDGRLRSWRLLAAIGIYAAVGYAVAGPASSRLNRARRHTRQLQASRC